MKVTLVAAAILFYACHPAFCQVGIHVYPAELSVPFGTAAGKLVAVGDMMVFVDDEKPEVHTCRRQVRWRSRFIGDLRGCY